MLKRRGGSEKPQKNDSQKEIKHPRKKALIDLTLTPDEPTPWYEPALAQQAATMSRVLTRHQRKLLVEQITTSNQTRIQTAAEVSAQKLLSVQTTHKQKLVEYSDTLSKLEIAKDGNCLFAAIAHQLSRLPTKQQLSHQQLRALAVKQISNNMPNYVNVIDGDIVRYIEEMRQDGIWGGEPEIHALADALQLQIQIHQLSSYQPHLHGSSHNPLIHLAYNGSTHYDSLIPTAELVVTQQATVSAIPVAAQKKTSLLLFDPPSPENATGMARQHRRETQKFSLVNQTIMIWRPINAETANKLVASTSAGNILHAKGKGLFIKAKSSIYGPIAGDIPTNVQLSKLALSDPEHAKKYQVTIHQQLADAQRILTAIDINIPSQLDQKLCLITDINQKELVVSIPKLDAQQKQIHCIANTGGEIIYEKLADNQKPIFVIYDETSQQWLRYNELIKQFSEPFQLGTNQTTSSVEILAYLELYLNEAGEIAKRYYPITADYDELTAASKKLFPLLNNKEGITTRLTPTFYEHLASAEPLTKLQTIVELVLAYELENKQQLREKGLFGSMGIVNDIQYAYKVFLKEATQGATNHGPEVNNPFPEPLVVGDYPIFLADGSIQVRHTEQELCNFINQQRKLGFPLEVNPKWGWDITPDTHELFVPEQKLDWDWIHAAMAEQQYHLKQLKNKVERAQARCNIIKSSISENTNNEEYHLLEQQIADLSSQLEQDSQHYATEVKLIDLKVKLESLRLESNIIYSLDLTERGMDLADNETEAMRLLRLQAEPLIQQQEYKYRQREIQQLANELNKQKTIYFNIYKEPSLLQQMEEKLLRTNNRTFTMVNQNKILQTSNESTFYVGKSPF